MLRDGGVAAGMMRHPAASSRLPTSCPACLPPYLPHPPPHSCHSLAAPAPHAPPQERDAFQDYNTHVVALYRQYLRSIHGAISHWNARWGSSWADWAGFRPPPLHMHGPHWNNSLTDLAYWDWQHFRHQRIHAAHENCCQHVAAHGLRCIMHFGEFFAATDAIYASGAVFTLAASPWLDYVVVDSNFISAALQPNDVRIVQVRWTRKERKSKRK